LPPRRASLGGMLVYFQGVGQYFEGSEVVWHSPDSGDGQILGPGGSAGSLIKLRSQNVTPGFSGSALLRDTDVGTHIVGMISRRYRSDNSSNRDTAWAIEPYTLRTAVELAAEAAYRMDPTRNSDLGPDPRLDWNRLAAAIRNDYPSRSSHDFVNRAFVANREFTITRLSDFRRSN
jgi:hypothetical protein